MSDQTRFCADCGTRLGPTTRGDYCRSHMMKRRHRDPVFVARLREAARDGNRRRHADPKRNPLAALNRDERADYDLIRVRGGCSRAEALAAIGRADLVQAQ